MQDIKPRFRLIILIQLEHSYINQVINKATIEFNVLDGSQSEYLAHDKLVLVRTNSAGENIFLSDFLLEGTIILEGI